MSKREQFINSENINLFTLQLNEKYEVYAKLDFINCNGIWLATVLNIYYYNIQTNEDFLCKTCDIFDRRTMIAKDCLKSCCNYHLAPIEDHYKKENYSIERVESIIADVKKMNENKKNKFVR